MNTDVSMEPQSTPSSPIRRPEGGKTEKTVKELIETAVEPRVWKDHLSKDLMKYWNMTSAYTMKDGLFPTYRSNHGELLPESAADLPEEIKRALANKDTKGLIELDYNFIRMHSRQTFAYGIAFHMTGDPVYLERCRNGALALVNAIDGNYGMYIRKQIKKNEWDTDRELRSSQDLAYGLTGIGMYYFLTHDPSMLHRVIQIKDYIFKFYMDDGRGYLTWYPKHTKDPQVQIVAQLDQLYAYMLMLTPSLPEPYKTIWKKDMKKIVDILITQFYSEKYKFFWGLETSSGSMSLGTDHTDFGHSVKTFWVIQKVGELLGDPFYIDFARPKIDQILKSAYLEDAGTWARRYDENGNLDTDREWWILAELNQACEILSIHDPSYYSYLNKTQRYWLDKMVDHEYGEIWHMVSGKDDRPVLSYPKIHSWKNGLHSTEHAIFGYMTASRIKDTELDLYYALPEWERPSHRTVAPYMFFGNILDIHKEHKLSFMPDQNFVYRVTYNGIH